MSLEEKIERLTPRQRSQVEDYVDFLISRSEPESPLSGFCDEEELSAPPLDAAQPSKRSMGTVQSSGIILAEERPYDDNPPDYVDFADINSRFGHTKGEGEGEKSHRSLRRLFDWI